MKLVSAILKVLAALAAIAGVVYVIATYGDKIVAWAKELLAKCPCKCNVEDCGDCKCECGCKCCCEDAPAEEAAPVAEEVIEEVIVEAGEPVAEEADFA